MIKRTFTYDGKRYWVRGETEKECQKKIAQKRAELELGIVKLKSKRVDEWAYEWLETYKAGVNPNHRYDLEKIIENFICPEIGAMQLKNVRPVTLQKLLNGTTQYSQSYCNKIHGVLVSIFRSAWQNGFITDDPTKSIIKVKGKANNERRALTERERRAFLDATKEDRYLLARLIFYCGLRPGEASALTWEEVDLDKRIINVKRAVKVSGEIGEPKTKSGIRSVPIPSPLLDQLSCGGDGFVCKTARGNHYSSVTRFRLWHEILDRMLEMDKDIGTDLTLYCLRHDYCTRLQEAGVPINVAKDLMGHSSIAITSKIYTHSTDVSIMSALAKIDAFCGKNVAGDSE